MMRRVLLVFLLTLLLAPAALAQDTDMEGDRPTVAFLVADDLPPYGIIFNEVLGSLMKGGYLVEADMPLLQRVQAGELVDEPGVDFEKTSVLWEVSSTDAADINLMVDRILDKEPDVIITFLDSVTLAAVYATQDMDDPPALIFTLVYNPYLNGIAQAPCIKPDHVAGVASIAPYDEIVSLVQVQDPDIEVVGVLYSSLDASSSYGAEAITEAAEGIGLQVKQAAVTQLADLRAATSSLLEGGVELIILPIDLVTSAGLPIIMSAAIDFDVPVLHSYGPAVTSGVTLSAGNIKPADVGQHAGHLLVAYLNGEIDFAETSIISQTSMGVGVNLAVAKRQGVQIAPALIDMADMIVRETGQVQIPDMATLVGLVQPDPAAKLDLASLQCTEEMIAVQQAELNAAGG